MYYIVRVEEEGSINTNIIYLFDLEALKLYNYVFQFMILTKNVVKFMF